MHGSESIQLASSSLARTNTGTVALLAGNDRRNRTAMLCLILVVLMREASSISCPPCSNGFQCDTNTGICRQFRQAYTSPTERPCGSCPQGTMCDSNTGVCRAFRFPGNYDQPSTSLCAEVTCPTGYMCDNNTGTCRKFREPNMPVFRDFKLKKNHNINRRQTGLCATELCPQGTQCDSNTGICRPFRSPPPSTDQCQVIGCPLGMQCDSNSGICRPFRPPPPAASDPCDGVLCSLGTQCDSNTGVCRPFRPTPGTTERCQGVLCPQGTECDSNTGTCRPFRQADNLPPVTCPTHSYFSDCASPCPNTCTESSSRCSLSCIPTCVCDQGYIQASATDTSCILSTQCQQYQVDRCTSVPCSSDMSCLDGYCNPRTCPSVVKPAIREGCRYMLTRNINGCLAIDLNC